mmetsp:Transcript_12809/g.33987  ORF Transcript_12809/g.33987 Transcript_12809/m.33987 type:complete len:82 (-) Transcript_12809:655-900(-)
MNPALKPYRKTLKNEVSSSKHAQAMLQEMPLLHRARSPCLLRPFLLKSSRLPSLLTQAWRPTAGLSLASFGQSLVCFHSLY